jgi:hypothetical protein
MKRTSSSGARHKVIMPGWLLLVMSLTEVSAQVPSYFEVPDVPTKILGTSYRPWDIVRNSSGSYSTVASLPAGTAVDGLCLLDGGNWLLSVEVPTNLGATTWDPRDVLRWDGAGGFSPYGPYAGAVAQIPVTSNVDAVFLDHTGAVIVSFDVPTRIGSITYQPADLVRYNGSTFDASPLRLPEIPITVNLSAAGRFGMFLAVSFDVPVVLDSGTYLPGQIASWTGNSLVPFDPQPAWPANHSSTVNAVTFSPTPSGAAQDPGEFPASPRSRGLVVDRLGSGMLRLSWSPSDCAGGENAGIYQGTLGSWYSHTAIACNDAFPYLQEDVPLPSGNAYFLVVPHNAVHEEGSYGVGRLGNLNAPRPRGASVCETTQTPGCAP